MRPLVPTKAYTPTKTCKHTWSYAPGATLNPALNMSESGFELTWQLHTAMSTDYTVGVHPQHTYWKDDLEMDPYMQT